MRSAMISIIVPVYNVEIYIKECLDSILAQTIRDFELILIDDGSTDYSGRICNEYKEKDSRVKVFHKENGGLSSARNKGLDEAKGEYICFIDSDDTIREDYLEKLYDAITSARSDMAFCDIDAQKLSGELNYNHSFKMTAKESRRWLYDDRTREYVLMVVAWNKIYTSRIFEDIRYPVGRLHEDEFVIGLILSKCSNISFVPEKLYFYRNNESGITSEAKKMNVKHLDGVDALSDRVALAISEKDNELAVVTLKNALYKCAHFFRDAKKNNSIEMKRASMRKYRETIKKYKEVLNMSQRLKYYFFTICPELFIKAFNP